MKIVNIALALFSFHFVSDSMAQTVAPDCTGGDCQRVDSTAAAQVNKLKQTSDSLSKIAPKKVLLATDDINQVDISPNPVATEIKFTPLNFDGIYELEVYNNDTRFHKSYANLKGQQIIDVRNFPPDTYTYVLYNHAAKFKNTGMFRKE